MILVTFALPHESADFLTRLQEVRTEWRRPLPCLVGRLGALEIAVAHTGVGPLAASACARQIRERFRPAFIICAGYAGALQAQLGIGDLVFDARNSGVPPPPAPRLFSGRIATSESAVESVGEKTGFAERTGGLAVDMEMATLAAELQELGAPVVGLRSISDRLHDPLPAPMEAWYDLGQQRPRPARLVLYLLRSPSRILPFVRFVRGLSRARQNLAAGLAALLQQLGDDPDRAQNALAASG